MQEAHYPCPHIHAKGLETEPQLKLIYIYTHTTGGWEVLRARVLAWDATGSELNPYRLKTNQINKCIPMLIVHTHTHTRVDMVDILAKSVVQ